MTIAEKLTLEQFLALPETEPASEFVCGEVLQKPMPDKPHAGIQLYLGGLLLQFLTRTRLGRAYTELRCIFGPSGQERVFIPDIVYASNERLGTDRFLRTAPDLAVEVLSPDQAMGRFAEKIQFYLRHGVRLVWVIDPIARTITVLTPDEQYTLSSGDTLDGREVLPGFSVPVDEILAQADL